MSGSLNLRGDLGEWIARTAANCPLGVNQTAFSVSGFIQVTSCADTTAVKVFGFESFPLSVPIFVQVGGSNGAISIQFKGGTSFYNWPIVSGETIHFAATFQYPGTAYIYVNGSQVASVATTGATLASANSIQIGWPGGQSGNVLISDFAFYNGTAETPTNILALRDRSTTPLALGWTSWWTLQGGTSGANPTTSDAGLLDQMGANPLTTISGPTFSNYSATTLDYVSPIVVSESYISRSGSIVFFFIGTNPAFGTSVPVYPAQINANPTFLHNGSAVSAQGPYWSSRVQHAHPPVGGLSA